MRIKDYPKITVLDPEQLILLDGNSGTKVIRVGDTPLALVQLNDVNNRRTIVRGKKIGVQLTEEQKASIRNGTFDDMFLGDYWEINGRKYRIVDFDYWYDKGDTRCTTHHVVVMPDSPMYTAAMHTSSSTSSGYVGSNMYTAGLNNAKSTINNDFSANNVLIHREFLINKTTSGYPSAGEWTDSSVELPNEIMIFGSFINSAANPGVTGEPTVKRYTVSNRQLALFNVCPKLATPRAGQTWLRDICSSTHYARLDDYGCCQATSATAEFGVRPVFGIVG